MRTPTLLAGLALGLLSTLSLGANASAPINIVQVADLSGPNGDTGKDFVTGARVYFDQLNARGGLNGRQLNLVVEDDGGEPATTVSLSRKLVSQYKPVALFGYFGADNVRAVLADKALSSQPAALVAPYVGTDLPAGSPVYYLRASSADEIAKITRIAASSGLNRIALVAGDDALGRSVSSEIEARLKDNKAVLAG
ncbi:ABC transporter substrate-binding protein, partial [Chitinimonas sp.]|uniref:ABC transporter substrate-binding protein n=1 Tax=Chitinimonas sp. TaxID=1934313 RepID=UPI002F95DECA